MSIQAVAWALDQDIPNAGLKLVLIALCNHADKGSGELFLRHSTVEKEASMSRSSVQRHVKMLADLGIIEIGSTFDASGRQAANSYRIIFGEAEQREVAANRAAAKGCQPDTLPNGEEPAVEGVNLTPRGSTSEVGEGVTADTPNTNHPLEPSSPLPPSRGSLGMDFEKLIAAWPSEKIGDRAAAERAYRSLTEVEREQALEVVRTFVRAMIFRKDRVPRLSVYLSERKFVEFHGAPDIDKDGDFYITPDRPEWREWLGSIRRQYGEAGVQSAVKHKFMKRKTRWPTDLSLANGVTKLVTYGTGLDTASATRG
jgi:hypothetical protein